MKPKWLMVQFCTPQGPCRAAPSWPSSDWLEIHFYILTNLGVSFFGLFVKKGARAFIAKPSNSFPFCVRQRYNGQDSTIKWFISEVIHLFPVLARTWNDTAKQWINALFFTQNFSLQLVASALSPVDCWRDNGSRLQYRMR